MNNVACCVSLLIACWLTSFSFLSYHSPSTRGTSDVHHDGPSPSYHHSIIINNNHDTSHHHSGRKRVVASFCFEFCHPGKRFHHAPRRRLDLQGRTVHRIRSLGGITGDHWYVKTIISVDLWPCHANMQWPLTMPFFTTNQIILHIFTIYGRTGVLLTRKKTDSEGNISETVLDQDTVMCAMSCR